MEALDFPNNVQIETTSRCNAECHFCPYPETSQTQPMGNMGDELFASIVRQLSQHPVHLIQPFLNNEPLMDPKIVLRLRMIREENPQARVCLTTNGSLLRDRIIRELATLELDTIHISSNGLTAETYRRTMGIDGYAVLRNVNALRDALRRAGAKTRLALTAVLMKANRAEVEHQRDYWKARGVSFYLNALNHRAGNLPGEAFEAQLPFAAEANKSQLRQHDMSGCPSMYSFMGIHWNGDVIACCNDWRRANVLGNAREQSLHEIWHDGPYRRMRALSEQGRLSEYPLCQACGEDRFSIDAEALEDFLNRSHSTRAVSRGDDIQVLDFLQATREKDRELIQFDLMR